jgi:precorrin-8X/cobalt-precorrin-8 methylmutase
MPTIITITGMIPAIRTGTGTRMGMAEPRYDYLRDPDAIYRRSFALIRQAADLSGLPRDLRPAAVRLIHTCGDVSIAGDLIMSPGAAARGRRALAADAPLLVDATMVAAGITSRSARCFLNDKRVPALAKRLKTTRSAAAVELWRPHLDGAVVAIGNAPTALFHLLEMIAAGAKRPALILGFPVGFVGAAESKAALAQNPWHIPFIALEGRRGGSAMAAAAVNALLQGPS